MDANRVFELLDGPSVVVSGRSWRVEVFSVFDDAEHRWIQLALDGPDHYMVTLRLEPGASSDSARLAIESWLENSDSEPFSEDWSDEVQNATAVPPAVLILH